MQQLRQAVLRDLAWLLNTTNLATSEELDPNSLAAASTLNFGIPGFTGMVGTSHRMAALETEIADGDPHLRAAHPAGDAGGAAAPAGRGPSHSASLVFEIQGELWAQPVPQQLFLETAIELETRLAVVTDAPVRG